MALIIFFLPLMRKNWDTIDFLGVNTALLFFLVSFETITKVGAVGRRYDQHGSAPVSYTHLTLPTSDLV